VERKGSEELEFCTTCGSSECTFDIGGCSLASLPSRKLFRTDEINALSSTGINLNSQKALWCRLERIQIWSKNKARKSGTHVMSSIFENKNVAALSDSEILYAANQLKLSNDSIKSMRMEIQKRSKVGSFSTPLGNIPTDFPLVCNKEGGARIHVYDLKDEEWSERYNTVCGHPIGNNKTCQGLLVLESQLIEVIP
jgi:hypothetical protein